MYSCPWIGTFNIVKMPLLPRLINKFSAMPTKTPNRMFYGI